MADFGMGTLLLPLSPTSSTEAGQLQLILEWYVGLPRDQGVLELAKAQAASDFDILTTILAAPRVLGLVSDFYRRQIEVQSQSASNPLKFALLKALREAIGIA